MIVGIQDVLRFEFQKFRILEILNFNPCVCLSHLLYIFGSIIDQCKCRHSVDPDQTAPTGAVWSGSTLFDQKASQTFKQTTFFLIGALRDNLLCAEFLEWTLPVVDLN